MTFPFGLTVTLTTRAKSGVDADGNDVYIGVSTTVSGCVYAPAGLVERIGGQDTVTTSPQLYIPAGTVIAAIDQITIPGRGVFEVDGDPADWGRHPMTGWTPPNNIVLKLRKVTG